MMDATVDNGLTQRGGERRGFSTIRSARKLLARPAVTRALWALTLIVGAAAIYQAGVHSHTADAYSYWSYRLDADPWACPPNTAIDGISCSHPYTPAFAQMLAPLQTLPFPVFSALWTAAAFTCLLILLGRWAGLAAILLPPVGHELANTNFALPLTLVAAFGTRYPVLWTVALLTKITPGIGAAWFLVRREWRNAGVVLGLTGLVVAASVFVAPDAWPAWLSWLAANTGHYEHPDAIPIPLWLRLPLALALVTWGARTDRRWTIALAMWLALPEMWVAESVILLGGLRSRVPALAVQGGKSGEVVDVPVREDVRRPGRDRVLPDPRAIE